MEPIQPQFPWQNRWYGSNSPEVMLICAIIDKAWEDVNYSHNKLNAINARSWFFSPTFIYYCELIKLSPEPIQDFVLKIGELNETL